MKPAILALLAWVSAGAASGEAVQQADVAIDAAGQQSFADPDAQWLQERLTSYCGYPSRPAQEEGVHSPLAKQGGYRLVQSQVLFRHGDRSAIQRSPAYD
jgi:hypothetical protein